MDDAELLYRYANSRSESAFSELVRQHLPLVYSAALRRLRGDTHRAEDVAQCVFAELARQARRLAHHRSLEAWLYTTTRNIVLETIRTEQRRAAREREAGMNGEPETMPPAADTDQLRPVIDAALDRLSARDREAVLLRFFAGRAFADIADRFGISENAARFRVNRALKRLRRTFEKSGISSTPAAIALVLSDQIHAAGAEAMVHMVTNGALAKASSASSVAGVTNILHLMSSTKAAAVAAVIVIGTGAVWLRRDYVALQTVKAQMAETARAVGDAAPGQPHASTIASHPPTEITPSKSAGNKVATRTATPNRRAGDARTVSSANAPANQPWNNDDAAVNWALSRNPAVRAALATWIKSAVHSQNAAFYRAAHLTPQQIDEFEDLGMQFNINMGSAVLTLRPEGKPIAQVQAEIHELLGDSASAQLAEFAKTRFMRGVTIGLAGFVYDSDTPLQPWQSEQLTQILAESSSKPAIGDAPFPKDIDWSKALPRARRVLTATQYEALKELAVVVKYAPAALNPAFPNTYGDGVNPPPFLFTMGTP